MPQTNTLAVSIAQMMIKIGRTGSALGEDPPSSKQTRQLPAPLRRTSEACALALSMSWKRSLLRMRIGIRRWKPVGRLECTLTALAPAVEPVPVMADQAKMKLDACKVLGS